MQEIKNGIDRTHLKCFNVLQNSLFYWRNLLLFILTHGEIFCNIAALLQCNQAINV